MTDNIIHVSFGEQRLWDQSRKAFSEPIIEAGLHLGDNAADLELRCNRFFDMIQGILKPSAKMDISVSLPTGLTPLQLEVMNKSIPDALQQSYHHAILHALNCALSASSEICTSRLAKGL